MRGILVVALLLTAGEAYAAPDGLSGIALIEPCRAAATGETYISQALQGACQGIVSAVWDLAGNCVPDAVTLGQVIRVTVRYMDAHPERLHQHVSALAMAAINETWPCGRK